MISIFMKKVLVIKLWKWNNFQVELCLFAPNSKIGWHKHLYQDIEVKHLWGVANYRVSKHLNPISYKANFLDTWPLKSFSVRAGTPHAAEIGSFGLVTLSVQRWRKAPKSVVNDYISINPELHFI